jgi:hypothetical protein
MNEKKPQDPKEETPEGPKELTDDDLKDVVGGGPDLDSNALHHGHPQ